MKRNFGKVLGEGMIRLAIASAAVLLVYNIATEEVRNCRILENPVTIEGKVVSSKLKGRNLEVRIDSSDAPIKFSAYIFNKRKYKHDIETIHELNEKLKGMKDHWVKVTGFKYTDIIYGSDIGEWRYSSLINP